jgi:hypothetical protein
MELACKKLHSPVWGVCILATKRQPGFCLGISLLRVREKTSLAHTYHVALAGGEQCQNGGLGVVEYQ